MRALYSILSKRAFAEALALLLLPVVLLLALAQTALASSVDLQGPRTEVPVTDPASGDSGTVDSVSGKCALCAAGSSVMALPMPPRIDPPPAMEGSVGAVPEVVLDTSAAPLLQSAWSYTKTLAIYNPGTIALIDYQVRLDLTYEPDMSADFSDVRFKVDTMGDFLPYWTESYSESVSAVMWVKVPSLPAQAITELIVYYGDPTAVDESDGDAVFEFFDDFEGVNLRT
jgi:hypothetical protein